MAAMKIDFVLDAACSPRSAADAQARPAALERWIARGDPVPFDATDIESCLQALFDLPRGRALPAAPLSLLGDGIEPGSDEWLRLDPVHLRADRLRLLLVPLAPDDIMPAEAEILQAALEPHFAQSGHTLVAGGSHRWYLRTPRPLELHTQPPAACAGALDERHLPSGADGAMFRRLVTEAQMLLHELPMNEAREASGKLPVTGFWPWGNGRMPAIERSCYTHACSDDPLVRGIARASGAEAASLPADAAGLAHMPPGARLIIHCSTAATPLSAIERLWVAPLEKRIEAGAIAELRLLLLRSDHSIARSITRRHLRRWWRRTKPLVHA
jgi:hypothetical protein